MVRSARKLKRLSRGRTNDDADGGAFAEFERVMFKERTKAWLDAAPPGRAHWRTQAEIRKMVSKGGKTAADVAWHAAAVPRLLTRAYAK